jgi:hypothetical protein
MADNMPCYNSRMADQYAHDSGLESEREMALEAEFDSAFEGVPDQLMDVIRCELSSNDKFAADIDAAIDRIIQERNAP